MRSRVEAMMGTQKQSMNPKGKGEDHRISEEQLKNKTYMTPKKMRTEPELIGEEQQNDI